MKTVRIEYTCDYCKRPIDQLSEDVKAIVVGRVNYNDQFISNDDVRHYHDYCLENLLSLEYADPEEEDPEEEEAVEEAVDPEPKGKDKYDLGKMCSLIQLGPDKGWTPKKISEEIGCPLSSVYYYQNKILKGWWPE